MARVRENRAHAHEVATKLIKEKRQELEGGTSQRDVLALLGSPYVPFVRKLDTWNDFQSFSQGKFLHESGLAAQ